MKTRTTAIATVMLAVALAIAAPVTARLLLSYDSRDALIGAVMRHDLKPTRGLEPLTPCLQASGKFVHERV